MESVIHDQLMCYLLDHSSITKAQHGFLANKSTGSNLLSCFNDWHLSVKNKKLIDNNNNNNNNEFNARFVFI